MKKLSAAVTALLISVQVFAFNFIDGNFDINTVVNESTKAALTQGINNAVQENILQNQKVPQHFQSEDKITLPIKQHMAFVKRDIERNCNLRYRFPNKKFIDEQKIQRERYKNIEKWQIPTKISTYIKNNFEFEKIHNVTAICKSVNETTIEVCFTVDRTSVSVLYTYTETPQQPSITHTIIK